MNRNVLQNSVQTLKILYMVVAGLALAGGLEKFVFDEGQFHLTTDIILWVFFIIFLSTVVRFAHGAMRHFDHYYIEEPQQIKWRRQPLWDFLFLGVEAFVFFILAFSLNNLPQFITFYLILLLVDTFWLLGIFSTHIRQIWSGTPKNWIIANLIVLISTGIPWLWLYKAEAAPQWLLSLFFAGVLAHTIMDYWRNWGFYFGQPLSSQPEKESSAPSDPNVSSAQNRKVGIVFMAGAYSGSDFNEIEKNIRLAESYSIELWNRGYKVFCPHLNTAHFEVKAKADEKTYKEFDMRMLQCCDAVFALPNWEESEGAKTEIDEAKRLGKPVFYSLDELPTRR